MSLGRNGCESQHWRNEEARHKDDNIFGSFVSTSYGSEKAVRSKDGGRLRNHSEAICRSKTEREELLRNEC